MVIKLKQIPKLLEIIKKFEITDNTKPIISYVEKTFNNSPVTDAIYPDFNDLGNFCKNAGLLIFDNNMIKITELGNRIFEKIEKNPNFDAQTKKLFVENCFLQGFFSSLIKEGLSRFVKDNNHIWAPSEKVFDLFSDKSLLPLLYECDLLTLIGDKVILNPAYAHKINLKTTKQVRLTQKQIDTQLKLMKKIGEIAEEIVLEYEKKRLSKLGHKFEASKVQQISPNYANAGYDIVSFNEKTFDGEYDRFIEVKGSSGKEIDFHWSENEIKTAEELGNRYWLYFVNNIDLYMRSSPQEPLKIQNPFDNIFKNSNYVKKSESYHIIQSTNL